MKYFVPGGVCAQVCRFNAIKRLVIWMTNKVMSIMVVGVEMGVILASELLWRQLCVWAMMLRIGIHGMAQRGAVL